MTGNKSQVTAVVAALLNAVFVPLQNWQPDLFTVQVQVAANVVVLWLYNWFMAMKVERHGVKK